MASKSHWMGGVACVLLIAAAALAQPPAESPAAKDGRLRVQGGETDVEMPEMPAPTATLVVTAASGQGTYWLGVQCFPVLPALRAQLNLPEKQGILVTGVLPESPAAKAGIAQHDVLVRAGDKPLSGSHDLLDAIGAANGGKLRIELIRGGKPKTIEVAPAKRPKEIRGAEVPPPPGPDAAGWEMVQKWMEGMIPGQEGQAGRPGVQFRVVQPGLIVPFPQNMNVGETPLPPDMSVTISKEGDHETKIVVKRGDRKWEAVQREISEKLPADVGQHVDRMLCRGLDNVKARLLAHLPPGAKIAISTPPLGTKQVQPPSAPGSLDERLQKRLDEMDRRIEKLLRAVDELRTGHGRQPAPESDEGK